MLDFLKCFTDKNNSNCKCMLKIPCLPRNLLCLHHLVGPSSQEHPERRNQYKNSAHTQEIMQSFSSCVELVPLARWCPSLLSAQQIPAPPDPRLAQSHLNGLADLCPPGERPPVIRCVQTRCEDSDNSNIKC